MVVNGVGDGFRNADLVVISSEVVWCSKEVFDTFVWQGRLIDQLPGGSAYWNCIAKCIFLFREKTLSDVWDSEEAQTSLLLTHSVSHLYFRGLERPVVYGPRIRIIQLKIRVLSEVLRQNILCIGLVFGVDFRLRQKRLWLAARGPALLGSGRCSVKVSVNSAVGLSIATGFCECLIDVWESEKILAEQCGSSM